MKPANEQTSASDHADLSLIVLTRDEEVNIAQCLQSVVGLVDEIFVVDSGSTDRTEDIAREFGAKVIHREFRNQAEQFNWALDNLPIRTEWVMRLDADEYLLPTLRDEIRRTLPGLPTSVAGLYLRRRVYFLGRWIRHGGYYPTWLLRVFRRGSCVAEQRQMDEHLVLLHGETTRLENDFVDWNHKDLASWTMKHVGYASREAAVLRGAEGGPDSRRSLGRQAARRRWLKSNVYGRVPLFVRAFAYFGYRYIVRAGFLDGREGLIFHFLQGCWYRFYVDATLVESRLNTPTHGPESDLAGDGLN